ncbi:MAG: aspartate aminotransferase family protein [Promethearchaeia archaeon]|nr:MAG: aspartate aminotransferase family protein [Candidatus Lokiarchaeia archaeon]
MTEQKKPIIGNNNQKTLYKMYSTYVSKSKADFFKSLGLGAIQGKREHIYITMLEGTRKNKPPIKLIDCRTSGGVFNLGHRNPSIIQALKEGIDGGLDIGDHHLISEQRALLAKKLAELMPRDISKTQFCVGGGEAIDLAIKLARSTTKRKKVISAKYAYHGVTGLAMGAGDSRFKDAFLWHPPDFKQVEFGNIESLKKEIDEDTACVILEIIPATGGILIAPPDYFTQVREICDEKGVIFIADEVQSGLGRTGEMWGIYGGVYENEKIVPDIMVLAKGMSAGIYPLATVSYKPYIDEVFQEDPFIHISTTGGSELGCYVTNKMLDIVSQPSFLNHVKVMGEQLGKGLHNLKEKFSKIIVDVRGRGLMWGVEFINDRYGIGYTLQMIQNGIFADYCGNKENTIKLMPPLIVNEKEMNEILNRLEIAMGNLPEIKI